MKLNYNELINYQKHWQENEHIPTQMATRLVELTDLFIQRAKENGNNAEEIVLLYPEDCLDYEVFMEFADIMCAYVTKRKEKGLKMHGWLCNYKVGVE